MKLKLKKDTEVFVAPADTKKEKPSTFILSESVGELKEINNQIAGLGVKAAELKKEIATEAREKFISHNFGRAGANVAQTIEVEDLSGNVAKVSFSSPKAVTKPSAIKILKDQLEGEYDNLVTESKFWSVEEGVLSGDAVQEIEEVLTKHGVPTSKRVIPSEVLKGLPFDSVEDQAMFDEMLGWRGARVLV